MRSIKSRIRTWLGITHIDTELEYLTGLIEKKYCLIIEDGQTISGCDFNLDDLGDERTAVLVRGERNIIANCHLFSKKSKVEVEEYKD
jgi:hypothetical protein